MQVEICAFSLASCLAAQAGGADRIELCGGAAEGGTTPSFGLVKTARHQVSIALYVMIRPRGGDFLYTDAEFEVMKEDILAVKELKVDGFVVGILKADGTVDEIRTRELVELASPLPVTFHRAFDMTSNPELALEAVIRTGAKRILTSGQQPNVGKGVDLLKKLVNQATGRIELMAGAGVNRDNVEMIAATGVDAIHLTGKKQYDSLMTFRQPAVSMASVAMGEYEYWETDESTVREVIQRCR